MPEVSDTGFDWADIADEAIERSGGTDATAADVLKLRRGLRLLTEQWNARGYNLWRVCSSSVVLTGLDPGMAIPRNVDDVITVRSRRWNGVTHGYGLPSEMPMKRLSEDEYALLANKDVKGQPAQFCLRRTDPPRMMVYPIGGNGETWEVIFTYVERPARFERYDGVDDSEVPGRWLAALVIGLALDLARKRPPYNEPLISRLNGEYLAAEDLAQKADRGRQRYRYRIAH